MLGSRLTKPAFLANVVLGLSFLASNHFIWGLFDNGHFMRNMNPLTITMDTVEPVPILPLVFFNFPFWLFWISTAVNLFFIIKPLRKENTPVLTRRSLKFAVLANVMASVAFLAVNIVIWRYFGISCKSLWVHVQHDSLLDNYEHMAC